MEHVKSSTNLLAITLSQLSPVSINMTLLRNLNWDPPSRFQMFLLLVTHMCNSCLAQPPPNISPLRSRTSTLYVKAVNSSFEAQNHIKLSSCLEDFSHCPFIGTDVVILGSGGDDSQKSRFCQSLTGSNTDLAEISCSSIQRVSR